MQKRTGGDGEFLTCSRFKVCLRSASASTLAILFLFTGCSEKSDQPVASPGTPLTIVPNTSVAGIHAGMTLQQVVAALGEPQRRTASALEYPRLGLAVI